MSAREPNVLGDIRKCPGSSVGDEDCHLRQHKYKVNDVGGSIRAAFLCASGSRG